MNCWYSGHELLSLTFIQSHNDRWIIPDFPQLYRVEESGWIDNMFRLGWLQQFPVYADRNFLGRFYEEDVVLFYDGNGYFKGVAVVLF